MGSITEDNQYIQEKANSVVRHKNQARYDVDFIHGLINNTAVLHVSFVPSPEETPMPVILPMIGQIGQYEGDDQAHCYLHGYVSSRLMNLANASSGQGLPLCVSATSVDGYVLSLTPFSHSYNFRSAVLYGHGTIVEDVGEKIWAMKLVTDSVIPGRYEGTRVPPDNAEMQSTRILKMRIDSASGKDREGVPNDERKDMKKEDVLDRVWTGVLPIRTVYEEPVPSPYNRVKKVPEYMASYVKEKNEEGLRYCSESARKECPAKRLKKKHDE